MEREIPALLTVEEAGRLLRIGRTKAYAMAREWRDTDGRAGLPVVDLGHVLRVPRRALDDLIGAELPDTLHATEEPELASSVEAAPTAYSQEAPPSLPPAPRRSRRHPKRIQNQLDLFKPPTGSS